MSKASKKFYGNKRIFMARAPLKGKLKTFHTLVGGSALWYCSAVSPSNQALSGMNTLQLELLAKTIGFRRKSDETWLDFRTRSMRGARHVLHSHHMERWSTIWLKRFWDYKGHIARALDRESPPASSLMDSVRTLEWWTEKQREGIRHPGQFFPYHTNEEKALNRAAGGTPWRQVAREVTRWSQCKGDLGQFHGRGMGIRTTACDWTLTPPPNPRIQSISRRLVRPLVTKVKPRAECVDGARKLAENKQSFATLITLPSLKPKS